MVQPDHRQVNLGGAREIKVAHHRYQPVNFLRVTAQDHRIAGINSNNAGTACPAAFPDAVINQIFQNFCDFPGNGVLQRDRPDNGLVLINVIYHPKNTADIRCGIYQNERVAFHNRRDNAALADEPFQGVGRCTRVHIIQLHNPGHDFPAGWLSPICARLARGKFTRNDLVFTFRDRQHGIAFHLHGGEKHFPDFGF